ncbi:hypothetical protein QCA50_018931 [Cerrena zonata]|uniref:Uncharacterized protein n=1 Tax=Cerrena zonata TaxID=2478898 RepID=A0AAW0FKJ3_9APHY
MPLWESEPQSRGTFGILSTCLSTMFICVWKAYHPDVPQKRPEERTWIAGTLESAGRFMGFLFAPEFLFAMALEQLIAARTMYHSVNRLDIFPPHPPWYSRWFRRQMNQTGGAIFLRLHPWTLTHSFYAVMGGFAEIVDGSQEGSTPPYCVLTWAEVYQILKEDPNRVPDISEKHILARSQNDTLTKAIAVTQIFSFCTTCILRRAERLSTSVLEISTIAYAVCAIVSYIPWWKKPLIMAEPTLIEKNRIHPRRSSPSRRSKSPRVAWWIRPNPLNKDKPSATAYILPTIYGLLHLLAWDHPFPTHGERILWRVSVITVSASLPVAFVFAFIYSCFIKEGEPIEEAFETIALLTYTPARLFMLVEPFRQLLYLPLDAYKVASWSNYLPQFG